MELKFTPLADDESRRTAYARRMKSYRTTAVVVLAAVFGFEILSTRPGPNTQTVATSPVARRSTALRMADVAAFRLGKMSADYSALLRLRRQNRDRDGDERHKDDALGGRLEAALIRLKVPVKIDQLDFDWRTSPFGAPAFDILRQSLASEYDEHTGAVYQLGVQLMAARWRAVSFQYTLTARSAGAPLTALAAPNAENPVAVHDRQAILAMLRAQSTAAIGKFELARFQPSVAVTDLLRTPDSATESMLQQIYSLDLAVETVLAQ
jgi:hypothetical protein